MADRLIWATLPSFLALDVGLMIDRQRASYAVAIAALPLVLLVVGRSSQNALRLHISDVARGRTAWVLLLLAAPPWTSTDITTLGSVQPDSGTSKAKALVLLGALGLAFLARNRVRWSAPICWLIAYVSAATLGAWLVGATNSDLARSARYVLLVLAAMWVATRLPLRELLELTAYTCFAVVSVALAGHLLGLNGYDENARLTGYWPSLQANELATVAAFALLIAAASWATGAWGGRRAVVFGVVCGWALVLTGSRTGIVAAVVGVAIIVVLRRNLKMALIGWAVALAVVALLFVQANTTYRPFQNLATRGGTAKSAATLTGRTYGWHAVIHNERPVSQKLVGKGLAAKTVKIDQAATGFYGYETGYTNIDGAWFAAYLEAGIIGLLALVAASGAALVAAVRTRDPSAIAVVALILIASFLNDTLNDASVSLVVLAGISTAALAAVKERDVARSNS